MAEDKKRVALIASCIFLLGMLIACGLSWRQHTHNIALTKQQLSLQSQRLITQIVLRLHTYEQGLRATRSVVQLLSPDLLNSENFRRYQHERDITVEFPGARGFGFIRRVPIAEEAYFLQSARADMGDTFNMLQLAPHQADRYVIQYIEPLETNLQARGLDIASEQKRKMAAERAAMSGNATLTGPITLVQASGKTLRSFLLLLPVYTPETPLDTELQRLQATYGWTYTPLVIDEVLFKIDLQSNALALEITDVTDQHPSDYFFSSFNDDETPLGELSYQQIRQVYGRDWLITTLPRAAFLQPLNLTSPVKVFVIGFLLAVLLGGMVATFLLNRIRERQRREEQARNLQLFNAALENQVTERTRLWEAAHHDLRTILDALPSMIGYWDATLHNRFANHAYHQWLGVAPDTLPGKHIRDVLGENLYKQNLPFMEAALQGVPQSFERSIPAPDRKGLRHSLAHYLPDIVNDEVRGFYVLIHDVTELTDNRETLSRLIRENEALLSTIKSRSIYSVTDYRGVILDVNDNFSDISGYNRNELLGQTHRLINSGYHPHEFWREMWRTISRGQAWRGEVCNRRKDGSLYWVDSIIAPFMGSGGQLERIISIRTDITTSKTAEQELKRERERLDNILRGTHVGTWEWNVQTGETHYNERWADIIGFSLQELVPVNIQTWLQRTHPEDIAICNDALQRHFNGELPFYEGEYRIRHREGHWVWVLDRGRVTTWTADGKPEWMYGTHQDISRSKSALQRLAENEAFLARAGRIAAIGAWRYDSTTSELFWARETKKLHDIDDSITPDLHDAIEFCEPNKRSLLETCFRHAIERGEGWDIEIPCTTASGRSVWMRMIGEVETNSQGQRLLQGVYQDITEARARREANSALQQAMSAAEAANAAKSQFLANMSHEIRTPLNAVIGLSYLLDKTRLDRHQKSLLAKIQVASDSLLGLINDVLDLSKIEAQQMVLDPVRFKLNDLLRDLRQLMTAHAESKHLDLIIHPSPGLPGHLRGDVIRIKQVLVNLLNNAIKFTEQGHVKLSVWSMKTTRFECHLHFSIRDTGVGISADSQPRLFKPFTQADASTTRRFGGSGLGLSIVQRLTELMGGQLGFSSVEGVGSEFWVELPLQLDLPEYAAEALRKGQIEILLISPEAELCHAAIQAAETLGWSMTCVQTLEKAIAKLHQAGITGLGFNAVLCASDTLTHCRRWYTDNAHKPLYSRNGEHTSPLWIMLDNAADTPAMTNTDAMGNGRIHPPLSAVTLFNGVCLATRQRGGSTLAILNTTAVFVSNLAWMPGIKVLVVDDSDLNREVASRILQREGARVDLAENGQQAIDYLTTADAPPALILMDIQMPVLDGIEATRQIKQTPAWAGIPIIALTAGALVAERQRAIEAGMSAFVSKPLDPAALVRLLRKQIETALNTYVPVCTTPLLADAFVATGEWPTLSSIDAPHAIRQFGNDLVLFRRILGSFLQQYDDIPQRVLTGLSKQDRLALAARLHRLRGSAALLGARHLVTHSKELEHALKAESVDHQVVRDSMAELVAAFLTLRSEAEPVLRPESFDAQASPQLARASMADFRPTDRFAIHKLHELLKQNDLHALAVFEPLTDALQQALGVDNFHRLRVCIEQFDFSSALAVLEQHSMV